MTPPDTFSHGTPGIWHFGGLTKRQLAKQTWQGMQRDEVLGRSAQLAYFFFFAIFPLAIFLIALLGVFAGPNSALVHGLLRHITQAMPASARPLVTHAIRHSLQGSGVGALTFGIIVALFSASSGMAAMIQTLNAVFHAKRERSMIRQRLVALGLTIAVGLLMCAAIFLITVGGRVAHAVSSGFLYIVWQTVQYPVAVVFLLVAFSIVYRVAPNVEHRRWRWVTPGGVAGVVLWVIVSFGLRVYLHHFNTYTSDYGTAGAVMVLLLWFYLTGVAFLMGGEVDAVIEGAAAGGDRQHSPSATTDRQARERAA